MEQFYHISALDVRRIPIRITNDLHFRAGFQLFRADGTHLGFWAILCAAITQFIRWQMPAPLADLQKDIVFYPAYFCPSV